jgi:hypothetical protein
MILQIPLRQFNLKSFIEESQRNGIENEISTIPVFCVESPEKFDCDPFELENEKAEIYYKYLVEEGGYVYVDFSSCYAGDREIPCIDGHNYFYITDEDIEDGVDEYEEVPVDVQPIKGFMLSEGNSIGYLLQYKDGKLYIQSSIFYLNGAGPCYLCPYSTIEPLDDAEIFDLPMKEYLGLFQVL